MSPQFPGTQYCNSGLSLSLPLPSLTCMLYKQTPISSFKVFQGLVTSPTPTPRLPLPYSKIYIVSGLERLGERLVESECLPEEQWQGSRERLERVWEPEQRQRCAWLLGSPGTNWFSLEMVEEIKASEGGWNFFPLNWYLMGNPIGQKPGHESLNWTWHLSQCWSFHSPNILADQIPTESVP